MKLPPPPHFVLLFFLGGVFLYFMQAGGRTLYSKNLENEPGALVGQLVFMFGGVIPIWFVGLYQAIPFVNGIIAAVILVACLALYEWTRHTIWGRRFGLGWGDHVPDAVCEAGPYRFARHPIYLSYMVAWLAALVALPHWITMALLVGGIALFTHAAHNDERTIAGSPISADYAAYRKRVGMFWPKFSSATPGRSTP